MDNNRGINFVTWTLERVSSNRVCLLANGKDLLTVLNDKLLVVYKQRDAKLGLVVGSLEGEKS